MLAACGGVAVGSCCDARALLRDAAAGPGPGPGPAWGGLRARDAAVLGLFVEEKAGRQRKGHRGGGGTSRFVAAWNGPISSFYNSRLGLDSQIFNSQDTSQMLRIGPVPGDISEVEAYCRIFRSAEQLHTIIMKTVCNPETGECTVSYDIPSENLPQLEEKVVTMLGCMLALLDRGREEVLSGRSSIANSFKASEVGLLDGKLPPLAVFRSDMKKCCESLYIALANYLTPDDRSVDIWRKMQRLRNVCYDAGFPRIEGQPSPMLFANWTSVCFSTQKEDTASEDLEVDFWKGGQVTDEGLSWLLENGYKTIVDLRDEVVKDEYYQTALAEAVSSGKIEVIALPVEVGTAPSMDQVEQFASLVSDSRRKPLYLHSQEGVSRTSAMVSRWKQYISRHASQSSPTSKFNGVSQKATEVSDQIESQTFGSSIQFLSYEGGIIFNDLVVNETTHFSGQNNKNEGVNIQQPSGEMDMLAPEMAGEETTSIFTMEVSPLEAQFPSGDIFSRRDLKKFFKDRKITPQTFLDFEKNRIDKRRSFRGRQKTRVQSIETHINEISEMKKPVHENSTATEPLVRSTSNNGGNICEAVHRNDMHETAIYDTTSPVTSSKSGAVNIHGVSTVIDDSPKSSNNGSIRSPENGIEIVNGNMCASATGVVRVQSRRKAEMFLVRTDGFSCTREKVTESSLAFSHPSTQQQMLMWKSSPKTVLLLKKLGKELLEETKEVAAFLHHQEKMNVLVEPDVHDVLARISGFGFVQTFYTHDTSDLHESVDFVVCLGGDGVILHASNLFRGAVPPVVSFNLGSLGFLTTHTFEDYREDLRAVIHGNNTLDGVYITLRMRLCCEIFRNGVALPGKIFDILNEVVVDRGSSPYISKIECYEQNRLITKVQGDGVIVATPTGSTAYSTSAGGSMVHPNVPCILFTPICPHSLSFRPVILPDSARLELKIPMDARSNAWVSFDGKRRQQLSRGDSVLISMSEHPLPTVNKSDQTGDWFRSLVRCLNWNERQEQRALLLNADD